MAPSGLTFGTRFDPRTVPLLFGIIVIPLTFLGCVYYSWSSLEPIRWLQVFVLVNPLVYMCEGFRAALTNAPHMSLWAIYAALHRVLRAVHVARDQRVQAPRPELNPGGTGYPGFRVRCDAGELLGGTRVDSV